MIDTAIILTTYNRPTLVARAIESVLVQDCDRWRLYIMDDGCNEAARDAIDAVACRRHQWFCRPSAPSDVCDSMVRVDWWKGPQRSMAERKSCIPYSRMINIALNHLLRDEQYVTYLCDDDVLHPESIRCRAQWLDAHPEDHVVYGRLRSVQFGADGSRNRWQNSGAPQPLTAAFRAPDGPRITQPGGTSFRAQYTSGADPDTGLPYVEEGFWLPGPTRYGDIGRCDHNQLMHRRQCLTHCREWPAHPQGGREWWAEDLRYGVGDAAFFTMVGEVHDFVGVDCWAVSKAYHALSDGVSDAEVRE